MKKTFLSWALALVALVFVSIPKAEAKVFEAGDFDALWFLVCRGTDGTEQLKSTDTIRLTADISYSVRVTVNKYFFIPENTTRNIDLNGHMIENKAIYEDVRFVFVMQSNSTLNIYDSKGGGSIINKTLENFVPKSENYFHEYTYNINSACIVNEKNGFDDKAATNCTVNVYGGSIVAINGGANVVDSKCSAILCYPDIVSYSNSQSLQYSGGGYLTDPNMTVNLYGGTIASIVSNKYSIKTYEEDYEKWYEITHTMQTPDMWLHFSYIDHFSNPLHINLYGGNIGYNGLTKALVYPKNFKGVLKEGFIFGIESEDHLNWFAGLDPNTTVYVDGTETSQSELVRQDLSEKIIRFVNEPEISVAGQPVTKDNCDDILPWEEFKASFDYSTNTLYLKSLQPNAMNTINGNITYDDFPLNIVVNGKWKINGRIVGHEGNLVISAAHPHVMVEEDADLLSIEANSTPISLNGKHFTAKHRVRVVINTQNTAVSCGMFAINNAWFEALGMKPMVDCQNSMIQNASITSGSLKNDAAVKIEPNIQKYVLSILKNIDEAGVVTGDGYYPEGTNVTVTVIPNEGYKFLRWDDGEEDQQRYVTMTQDIVLTAIFEADVVIPTYTVNVVSADETMGTVSGGGTDIPEGTVINITATPNSGYQFLYWTTANGQVQGKQETWTVTKDETLTAHFRTIPDPNDYNLWINGVRVTASNSNDVLGDGVWSFDIDTKTLYTMNHATYTLTGGTVFIDTSYDLTIVFNHLIDVTTSYEESTFSYSAINCTRSLHLTGHTWMGLTLTAKNMRAMTVNGTLTIDSHISINLYTQPTNEFGKGIKQALYLSANSPAMAVDGAQVDIMSGVGQTDNAFKVSNRTADKLQLTNGSADGSLETKSLYIYDESPKYKLDYITPSLESLCQVGGFGEWFEGTYCTLRAYPQTGYKFVSWSDGNTDNPRYMVMPAEDVLIDPIVTEDTEIGQNGAIINANATEGQGTISNFTSGWYAEGTELTITAVAEEGYEFVEWSDGKTENPYLLTVVDKQNVSITACFQQNASTGIESLQHSDVSIQKILRDGQIFILRDGNTYTITGQEVR